jgi:hypothetical protein
LSNLQGFILYREWLDVERIERCCKDRIHPLHPIDGKRRERNAAVYYGSEACAEVTGKGIRSHRGIENKLHRQLDVSFSEDQSRKQDGYAAQNFSLLNRIALNPVNNELCHKRSVKGKRFDAGWNNDYLLKIWW